MALPYSRRLYGPNNPTVAGTVLFTVPVGHVYIVMSMLLVVHSVGAGNFISLSIGGTGTANRVIRTPLVTDTMTVYDELRLVLGAGEQLLLALGNASATVTLNGYDLNA